MAEHTTGFDRAALNELFDYTTFTWETYGRSLAALAPDAFTQPIPDSGWQTLAGLLFHIALGWDDWLRDRVGVDDPLDATPESITSWDDLRPHRERVRGWLRRVIDETSDHDLPERSIERPGTRVSVADILTHILLHERGHHGDVSTLLARLGATPPTSDYLVYVFFRNRRG
jgi:uncharacterized damage-inducible protein DinB